MARNLIPTNHKTQVRSGNMSSNIDIERLGEQYDLRSTPSEYLVWIFKSNGIEAKIAWELPKELTTTELILSVGTIVDSNGKHWIDNAHGESITACLDPLSVRILNNLSHSLPGPS